MCQPCLFFLKKFYLLILDRGKGERERQQCDVPLTDASTGWFLGVPSPGIEPATLEFWDHTLTNWAARPGPDLSVLALTVCIAEAFQYVLLPGIANTPSLFFHLKHFLAILAHLVPRRLLQATYRVSKTMCPGTPMGTGLICRVRHLYGDVPPADTCNACTIA